MSRDDSGEVGRSLKYELITESCVVLQESVAWYHRMRTTFTTRA